METADQIIFQSFGRNIDWDNPQELNEKINWLKFHADPYVWAKLADKYQVREYVKDRGLEDILIPLYGKWDSAEEGLAAWDSLPDEFVLKSSNGCGNQMIVSKKWWESAVNQEKMRKTLNKWLNQNDYGLMQAELHYQLIENCILAEELLNDETVEEF